MKALRFGALAGLMATFSPAPTMAAESSAKSANVAVRLSSEVLSIQPGKAFTMALHLTMAPGWHTYWKNPGDSGMPTRVVWTLPDGFKADDLDWPAPERAVDAGLARYGYERSATFLARITPPPSLPAGKFTLAASVSWLECRDICIPGKATLDVVLPGSPAAARLDPAAHALFAAARASMPRTSATLKASHAALGDRLVLRIGGAPALALPLEFFPDTPGLIEAAEAPAASKAGGLWEISMKRPANAPAVPEALHGVLVTGSGAARKAYNITALAADNRERTLR